MCSNFPSTHYSYRHRCRSHTGGRRKKFCAHIGRAAPFCQCNQSLCPGNFRRPSGTGEPTKPYHHHHDPTRFRPGSALVTILRRHGHLASVRPGYSIERSVASVPAAVRRRACLYLAGKPLSLKRPFGRLHRLSCEFQGDMDTNDAGRRGARTACITAGRVRPDPGECTCAGDHCRSVDLPPLTAASAYNCQILQ